MTKMPGPLPHLYSDLRSIFRRSIRDLLYRAYRFDYKSSRNSLKAEDNSGVHIQVHLKDSSNVQATFNLVQASLARPLGLHPSATKACCPVHGARYHLIIKQE